MKRRPPVFTRSATLFPYTPLVRASGYRQGEVVTPYYDPMVAKLIAWGEDRDTARGRAVTALRALRVEGIRTNRDFLIACVEDETFAAGDVHTGFINARRSVLLAA